MKFVLICILLSFCACSETLMLKNGNLISGTIKSLENEVYTVIAGEDKLEIEKKNIELILMDETETGIYENSYKNFKYRFSIVKPLRLFYIPVKTPNTNTIVKIARKLMLEDSDYSIITDVIKLRGHVENNNSTAYIKTCEQTLRENYKGFIRFPGELRIINNYNAFVQKMTIDRTQYGKTLKFMLKQMIIIREDLAYVITAQEEFRKFEKSEEEIDSVINSFRFLEDIDMFSNIAYMYYFKKDYMNAIRFFEKAIESRPDNVDLYNKLGIMYTFIGNFKKARECFEKGTIMDKADRLMEFNRDNTGSDNFTGLPFN